MSAAAMVLFTAAGLMFGFGPAFLLVLAVIDRREQRRERLRRERQAREVTPEWLAVLAATEPTPIYDALVCEQMERAEGWAS